MKELITYLNDNISMRLNRVEYKRVDISNEETINFYVKDNFRISHEEERNFSIIVERRVYCIPESLMDIKVEFEIQRYIDEKTEVKLSEFDLNDEITEENIDEYIDDNLNRASALISNIISSFGMAPLVTPPVFINEEA